MGPEEKSKLTLYICDEITEFSGVSQEETDGNKEVKKAIAAFDAELQRVIDYILTSSTYRAIIEAVMEEFDAALIADTYAGYEAQAEWDEFKKLAHEMGLQYRADSIPEPKNIYHHGLKMYNEPTRRPPRKQARACIYRRQGGKRRDKHGNFTG